MALSVTEISTWSAGGAISAAEDPELWVFWYVLSANLGSCPVNVDLAAVMFLALLFFAFDSH